MKRTTLATILLLAPFIFTFAFALDVYLPSIPTIRVYFGVSPFLMQLTVSIFLLITGIGQVLFGPISDQHGRRWIIISGVVIFLLGSLLAIISPNIYVFIAARAIEGLGACCMMVATFAVVRDLYSGDDTAKIYSFLNSTIALSPLIAPTIGGYLAKWYGWRAGFVFLSLMAVLIAVVALIKLDETLPKERRVKMSRNLFCNYLTVLKHKQFLMYTFCASAGFACFLTFFSVSSYIIIKLLGVAEQHFGFYFAFIGLIFFISSLIAGALAKKVGTYQTVLLGTALVVLAGCVMLLWYYFAGLSMLGFMGPMMIMGLGGAMLMGAGAGGAIEPFPQMAGAASAVFGGCQFVFAFIVSTLVLEWKVTSTIPLGLTMLVLGVLSLLWCLYFYKCRRNF